MSALLLGAGAGGEVRGTQTLSPVRVVVCVPDLPALPSSGSSGVRVPGTRTPGIPQCHREAVRQNEQTPRTIICPGGVLVPTTARPYNDRHQAQSPMDAASRRVLTSERRGFRSWQPRHRLRGRKLPSLREHRISSRASLLIRYVGRSSRQIGAPDLDSRPTDRSTLTCGLHRTRKRRFNDTTHD